MTPLSAPELAAWLQVGSADDRGTPLLVDVREPWEFEKGHITGSISVPMADVVDRLSGADRAQAIVCICHHGSRSHQVAQFIAAQGVRNVFNLTGGVDAWARLVDPAFPRY